MAQEPREPNKKNSAAGKPSSQGMKIGFLLAGSPGEERVQAVLAALTLLEGVSSVRLAWSDASQAEFSAMSSFSASPGELIDRLSDELLHLPGFRVQIQGVNRVPYPVLVFRAEPGAMDRNAVRRRSMARPTLLQQEEARRGAARIDRPQAGTQPGRTPGAGINEDIEDTPGENVASDETPPETTWAPGRMASTVEEPGFENVKPRLRPAARPRPDPIEPVVRSHYPRPLPVDEAGQSAPGTRDIPDISEADWLLDVAEEAERSGERLHAGVPVGVRGAEEASEEEADWQKLSTRGRAGATRNRPRLGSLWNRAMNALFGENGPDTPVANDADDMETVSKAQGESGHGDLEESEPVVEPDDVMAAASMESEGQPDPDREPGKTRDDSSPT